MENKKKLIILGIIALTLVIIGTTYAILTWTSTKINLGLNSGCFTIDYTKGQDISGNLKLLNINEQFDNDGNFIIAEGMGLSYANLGIKSSCTIEGYGSLYLNVTTLSDAFKEGGDSYNTLGYALLRNTSNLSNDKLTMENLKGQSFEIIDIKPITNIGTIKLVTEQLSNTELNKYLIVIFVDSESAGNSITSATFQGNINADAEQTVPTPDYCFNLVEKDEENKTASIGGGYVEHFKQYLGLGYKCYEGNEEGYETITDVIIPEKIDGYTITEIKGSAFRDAGLTSVVIPSTVVIIGVSNADQTYYGAFEENKLSKITIPDSVTTIDKNAFRNNKIKKVIIPASVTSIGEEIFQGNNTLEEIVVDENNPTYDSRSDSNAIIETSTNTLIQGCKKTTIPDTITDIEWFAFCAMDLTRMIIPDSVVTIGGFAFKSNELTEIVIPDSVTTIGSYAFQFNNLNYVLINSNSKLTGVGANAFSSSNDPIAYNRPDNPNLKIYNNSGKAFDWNKAVNGTSGTTFVTGTTNSKTIGSSTTYNAVTVTTGQPS